MDDQERADYEQFQAEERRRYDESVARYEAANPLWDKCIKHPERQREDVGGQPYCTECRERHRANYAAGMSAGGSTYEYHGPEIMGADGIFRREQRLKT